MVYLGRICRNIHLKGQLNQKLHRLQSKTQFDNAAT